LTGIGCITDLAVANPKSVFIVSVSSSYFSVIKDDLISARTALASPDQLLVISAGTRPVASLGDSLLPIDARFENLVGGARATLNARMLRHIVEENRQERISASKISVYLSAIATTLKSPRSFDRRSLGDKEITAFIRKQLRLVPRCNASALLRILRDQGMACEQKRFRRIYKTIYPI
jgi:DNA-binding transcriptional ArsR family regulator